jgi:hypothetical protein
MPSEFEGDKSSDNRRRKPIGMLAGLVPSANDADYDPARRTSVASASAVVLQAFDGEDLGPEADDQEKSKLNKQIEKAKNRR